MNDFTYAKDKPDSRDFKARDMVASGSGIDYPEELDMSGIIRDIVGYQGMSNHCTSYGLTHAAEIANTRELGKIIDLDAEEQWNNQMKYPGTAKEDGGDYLQSALKSMLRFGLGGFTIDGYAKVEHDDLKKYLNEGFPIYTGMPTYKYSWTDAARKGYWTDRGDEKGGHAFIIVGYDREGWIALNSYNKNWGKNRNGTFKIFYDDTSVLYSSYIIYDTKDMTEDAKKYEQEKQEAADWFKEHGIITKFDNPKDPVTLERLAVILYRLAKKIMSWVK